MIPLHDNIPTRRFPAVTVLLILANVAVYAVDFLTRHEVVVGRAIDQFGRQVQLVDTVGGLSTQYSMVPSHVYNSLPDAWPTIFTSMFLHGGFMHIAGNMLYLWIFGNNVEDALGRVRYVLFYLACGFIAAFAHVATGPNSTIPTVGASGAVAGLMGAYLVLYPHAEITAIVPIFFIGTIQEVPALIVIGFWAVIQFANANWFGGGMRGGGVAYMAHVGGFLGGVVLILLLGGRRLLEDKPDKRKDRFGYDDYTR